MFFTEEHGEIVEYVKVLSQQKDAQKSKYMENLKLVAPTVQVEKSHDIKQHGDTLVNINLKFESFEASCDILRKIGKASSSRKISYVPTSFIGTHSIGRDHKLELAFVGYVLSKLENVFPEQGVIVTAGGESHRISLRPLLRPLHKIISVLQAWRESPPSQSPPVILNRHCQYCQFNHLCKLKAEQDDNLSLLSGMTSKAIRGYEKKGIFTIKQLSYLFRPRRLKKQAKNRNKTHKPELQALAIRTGKTFIQELPNLTRHKVELYLDIEGVPDQHVYYLIGLLVCEDGHNVYHPFWVDTDCDESQILQGFIDKAREHADAPIYHYGNYDARAIDILSLRYGIEIEDLKKRFVNVNSYLYGKIYFPVRSNGLKEIGGFIGASWAVPDSSGLQSLVWRFYWEETLDVQYKNYLLNYNRDDCSALRMLTDELTRIKDSANVLSEMDFISSPKRNATESGEQIHSQFETILVFAHANYDEKKIKFRRQAGEDEEVKDEPKPGRKLGYQGQRRIKPKAMKFIQVPTAQICPYDGSQLRPTDLVSKRLIIDLVLTKSGIRKTITEYGGKQGYCAKCTRSYAPPGIRKYGPNQVYGHGFQAWVIYQRVALRMTYNNIAEALLEQFREREPGRNIAAFIRSMSQYYKETEESITRKLLESPVIHADETPINVRGTTEYVWTFTNDLYVIFKFSKTREATIAHEFLKSYKGVLISDFYAGYDSILCVQQKCWVHLIRDLNDDLWEAPFDMELERLVGEVRNLIIPIMEAVQKYGLKKWHLHKFMRQVGQFYERAITDKDFRSEIAGKYQKRFVKYRDSLFTFLQHDDIPWHNNTAERALRHVAIQQQVSRMFTEQVTPDYLRLLSIRQTLRFQGKSFFRFLFSEEKDIDKAK